MHRKLSFSFCVLAVLISVSAANSLADTVSVSPYFYSVSAGRYTAWYGVAGSGGSTSVYIDGPSGIEEFRFRFFFDVPGALLLNPFGQLAGYGEATDDPFAFFAIYGTGGNLESPGLGNGSGFLPGSLVTGNFGSLGWRNPYPDCAPFTECFQVGPGGATITSLSNQGQVRGFINYQTEAENPDVTVPGSVLMDLTWDLGRAQPVAEPTTLVLLGFPVVLLAAKRMMHRC